MTIRYLPLTQDEQLALELAANGISEHDAAELMELPLSAYLVLYERAVAKLADRWGDTEIGVLKRVITMALIVIAMMQPVFDIDLRQPSSRVVRVRTREDVA